MREVNLKRHTKVVRENHSCRSKAPTSLVFAYHFSSALQNEWFSLLFRITIAEHFVYAVSSSFSSAMIGGSVGHTQDLEGSKIFA